MNIGMLGPLPMPNKPKEPPKMQVSNLSLHLDIVKKSEVSKDDVIIVRIKSSAQGINSTLVEQIMDEHFPDNKVLIIDDSLDIEFVKTIK